MYKIKIFLLILFFFQPIESKQIGLLIVATGKYIQFVPNLITSARKYFCKNHNIRYFVFTDSPFQFGEDTTVLSHSRLGWPYDTMMRCSVYYKYKEIISEMDYLFATDADMLFVDSVGDEILGERVGTQHPGFYNKRGTYETNPVSTAYVAPREGTYYFAGGFHGGSSAEFIKLIEFMIRNIEIDRTRGHIALWHDESHLNRYFINNPPTVILNPSYCYPESWRLPYPKKLLALDKNHAAVRE